MVTFVTQLRQDARYALRQLRRTPGFAAIAIAVLALGIGASTAIFSIIDAVLLRPLNFAEPQELTMIRPSSGARVSASYFQEWRAGSRGFIDLAAWRDVRANLTGAGPPLEILADRVTVNFFALLGVPAVVGRTFTSTPTLAVVQAEVVLSHGLWQRRFGADPGVIGQPITLDGERLTIVGVMPAGFTIRTTELAESRAELWMPLSLAPGDPVGMGGDLNVVARLAPGVTIEQGREELALIAQRLEAAHPSYSSEWRVEVSSLQAATVKDVRLALFVLFGAVGLLLLLACANVANLVLSRLAARETELAIRLSLGATRARLLRQLLTESFVLTAAGGALGVLLTIWGTQLLVRFLPAGVDLPRAHEIGVNLRVLLIASVAMTLITAFVGLVPWVNAVRSVPQSALRETMRGSSGGRRRTRLRGALIISEVAIAMMLLAGAGLLVRSFAALIQVNPGFRTERVLTMRTTLPASRYSSDDRIRSFSRELLQRIARLPGVRAVGSVNYLPMSRFGVADRFEIAGRPETRTEEQKFSWVSVVGGRYFEAMGIPLLRGRLPTDADSETTQPVVVIDQELAERYWAHEDPIGTRISWSRGQGETKSGEIIGVVGGVRWNGMAATPQATTYFWLPQEPGRELTIVTRTVADPTAMARSIAAQVGEIDASQPVAEIRAMQDLVAADLARPRFTMFLLVGFAASALLLAAIGLYGVIAVGVAQRTREIGIRVALGARPVDVVRLVIQRGMVLAGTGIAIGIAAALALGGVMAGLVYGITPRDPVTLVTVASVLAIVAMVAAYVPARRAARLDPIVALRAE